MLMINMLKHSVFIFVLSVFAADGTKVIQPEFVPKPGEVKIIEGDTLDLEITNIKDGNCTYTTGIGQVYNCSYELQSFLDPEKGNCSSKVSTSYSSCKVTILSFDESFPREWTLSSDKSPDYHFTVTVKLYRKSEFLQDPIQLTEGSGFMQYMKIPTNRTIEKCSAEYGNETFDLDLHSKSRPQGEDLDEDLVGRIKSLGDGICGFSLANVNKSDPGEWSLEALDSEDNVYLGNFEVKFTGAIEDTEIQVIFGDSVTIPCGTYSDEFCALENPAHEQMLKGQYECTYSIDTVGKKDLGMWKCFTANSQSTGLIENYINITLKDDVHINTWNEDRKDHIRIGCQVLNHPDLKPSFCMMTDPAGVTHIIRTSSATDRYSSLTTDLKNNTCGIEIYKPLLQHELGQWTCQLDDNLGGLINLGDLPKYPHHLIRNIQLDSSLTILCQVPYSTNYCHITAPDGEIYKNENEYKSRVGVCAMTVKKAELKHNGTWTCSFARDNGMPDEVVITEVKVAEQLLTYNTTVANKSQTVELMCQTGLPIKYCRFISPTGQSYHLSEVQSGPIVTYRGRGLEYGDCGIAISNVTQEHAGTWTCMTQIGKSFDRAEIKAEILLKVNDKPNVVMIQSSSVFALTIGICVAVLLVIAVVVTLVYLARRQNWLEASVRRIRLSRGSFNRNFNNDTPPPKYEDSERI